MDKSNNKKMIRSGLLYLLQKSHQIEKKQQKACTKNILYLSLHRFRDKTTDS